MNIDALKHWFLQVRRDLPWRGNPSPYEVWVSEVMLQQTQVSVVIDYFIRWMEKFPTIDALANASVQEVVKAWEGLGYYTRARNLHKGAKMLSGQLPSTKEELLKVPGIGAYTAAAILSFAFHEKAAAVDGNVLRVIARYFCIEEEIDRPAIQKKVTALVEGLLPDQEPWIVMEALIELGAKVCKKKADCFSCPLKNNCQGRKKGMVEALPMKGKKMVVTQLIRHVAVIRSEDHFLVRKTDSGKVMADLYEFPYWENESRIGELGVELSFLKKLEKVKHSFTRFRCELFPILWSAKEIFSILGCQWIALDQLAKLPFSSGHRRIMQQVIYTPST
jgi:A/G-specific adenine glycosylase